MGPITIQHTIVEIACLLGAKGQQHLALSINDVVLELAGELLVYTVRLWLVGDGALAFLLVI